MKKYFAGMIVFLAMVVMVGCKRGVEEMELQLSDTSDTVLLIKEDGQVQSSMYEDFEKNYYDVDELTVFLNERVDEYNEKNGAGSVAFCGVEKKDEKVTALFSYESIQDYADFQKNVCKIATMEEAAGEGVFSGASFIDVDNQPAETVDVMKDEKDQVLCFTGKSQIRSEKPILYVSGAEYVDEHTVNVSGTALLIIQE